MTCAEITGSFSCFFGRAVFIKLFFFRIVTYVCCSFSRTFFTVVLTCTCVFNMAVGVTWVFSEVSDFVKP